MIKIPDFFKPKKPDIIKLKSKRDIPRLIKALQYNDFDVHSEATRVLGEIGPDGMNALLKAFKSNNKDVKLGIINAFSQMKDPKSVPILLVALKDENSEIRWQAAIALGEIGDPRAIDPLVKALRDNDKYVRFGSAFSLAKIGWIPPDISEKAFYFLGMQEWKAVQLIGKPAIPALTHVLKDKDSNVRMKAVEVLGDIKDPDATPALMNSLADENSEVRWKAVLASPKCRIKLLYLPRGLSRRPKIKKNPLIAAFLNFMLPGMGYNYLGKWYGVMIFQIDITATVWLFKIGGEGITYNVLFPIYLLLAIHAYYVTKKTPEPSI